MRLIDLFPSWMVGKGIFSALGAWTPWAEDENTDINALDIEYLGNRSGYKETSPLLDKLAGFPSQIPLSEVQIERIVSVIKTMYNLSWSKLWDAMRIDYAPLENYRMVEDGTDSAEVNETKTMTKGTKEETSSNAKVTSDATTKNKVVPFGSSSAVETDESDADTTTESGEADNYGKTEYSGADTDETEATDEKAHHLTRSGNIGVTTSQQMLQSEIELRKQHYFDLVFADLDAVLTSPVWRT